MRMDLLTRATAEFDLLTVSQITYSVIFLARPAMRRDRILCWQSEFVALSIFGCEKTKF